MAPNNSTSFLQGGMALQGHKPNKSQLPGSTQALTIQGPASASQTLQPTAAPTRNQTLARSIPTKNTSNVTQANVEIDAAAAAKAAADAKAAEDARKAGVLRGEVTTLVNSIKDLLNARYGQIDAAAGEQVSKLNSRFTDESGELTSQIAGETELAGASSAAAGAFDSSYRGNNQDTITNEGRAQIRKLGTELEDDTAQVGQYVIGQKAAVEADVRSQDDIVRRVGEEADLGRLTDLRNTLEARIHQVRAGTVDNTTQKQALTALSSIAPTGARAQKLQTTLAKIVGGTAPAAQKSAIAQQLILASGVSSAEQQQLLQAFQSDISQKEQIA